jgi:hypothetical protein
MSDREGALGGGQRLVQPALVSVEDRLTDQHIGKDRRRGVVQFFGNRNRPLVGDLRVGGLSIIRGDGAEPLQGPGNSHGVPRREERPKSGGNFNSGYRFGETLLRTQHVAQFVSRIRRMTVALFARSVALVGFEHSS